MTVTKKTEPRAIVHRRTGAVALHVPFIVDGEEATVKIGIQATGIPIHMFDSPAAATRLRAAMVEALTEDILVKYEKGLIERQKLTDVVTDVISAHARNTL